MTWLMRNTTKTDNDMANQKYDENRQCHGLSKIRRKQAMTWLIRNMTKKGNAMANQKHDENRQCHGQIEI